MRKSNHRQERAIRVLGAVLSALLFIYTALIMASQAHAEGPPKYKVKLILEIRDEKLRIFEYETPLMRCHVSIIDVKMIGSQASVSCVRNDEAYRRDLPLTIPVYPVAPPANP